MECASAINSYLDFRRRYGETITDDSYLIRKQFDRQNPREHLTKVSDANDPPEKHKVGEGNIQYIIYQLIYDSGIRNHENKKRRNGERHKNMASHSFRKFFENKCLESGIDPFYVSVLMGHKAGIGVERHYYRPDSINGEFSLLELYVKKAIPFLTISDENRLRLKNKELEMRIQADTNRIREAEASIREALEKSLRERERKDYDIIASMGDRINELSRELTELKKEGMKHKWDG